MRRAILIGFMGSGKSTLGKKVAHHLELPFYDSDSELEAMFQMSIGEMFGEFGEARFRELEADYIQSLHDEGEFVLATGGGLPCYNNGIDLLNELGTTFYLERPAKELVHRLRNAKNQRPLISGLSDDELLGFVESKLAEREDFYKKATFTLAREEQTVQEIKAIIDHLHPHQKS